MKGFFTSIGISVLIFTIAFAPIALIFGGVFIAILLVAVACDLFSAVRGSRRDLSPHRGYRDR